LAEKAWALIEEVEGMGGMTKAVIEGLPKRLIEEAATRKQAAIDRGDEVIVGVNKYRLENEDELDILDIENAAHAETQNARIEKTLRQRAPNRWEEAIAALREVARSGKGNIPEAAVEAARARATLGEISDALRGAFGDHSAVPKVVRHVYGPAY